MPVNKRPIVIRFVVGFCALAMMAAIYFLISEDYQLVQTTCIPPRHHPVRYSFFVVGQAFEDDSTLRYAHWDSLSNDTSLAFGFFTGNVVDTATIESFDRLDSALGNLSAKSFMIAGEREMVDRPLFEERYGSLAYSFQYQGDQFVVLGGDVEKQLPVLEQALATGSSGKCLFVLMHRAPDSSSVTFATMRKLIESSPYRALVFAALPANGPAQSSAFDTGGSSTFPILLTRGSPEFDPYYFRVSVSKGAGLPRVEALP